MPSKPLKKSTIKKKQNGKKNIKGQMARSKQKSEMDNSPKEQITELDKEIFTININEYESKLSRKQQLCTYLEEEISVYKTLYDQKLLLKSESMKLLNKAFEDFSTEIFLLDQEFNSMKHAYSEILQEHVFCSSYKERVKKLILVEDKLDESLSEAEKCVEELPKLSEKLAKLLEEAIKRQAKFIHEKQAILKEFETCLCSIQDELNLSINKAVGDKSLKLDLLPAPYKTLFVNGFLSRLWLDSAVQFFNSLQMQNSELKKTYNNLLLALVSGEEKIEIFSDHDITILFQLKKDTEDRIEVNQSSEPNKPQAVADVTDESVKHFLQLEKMNLEQRIKVKSMKSEIKNLEAAIKSFEISGETTFEKSYLIQIIYKAGSILKQQM